MEILKFKYCDLNHTLFRDSVHNFTGKIEYTDTGCFIYVKNGKRHREDGIAVFPGFLPTPRPGFYLNGIEYSKEQWFEALTEEQRIQALWNVDEWNIYK